MKITTFLRRAFAAAVCAVMLITCALPSFANGNDCCAGLTPGDANGDASVGLKDVAVMLRYCAGYDIQIVLENADVRNDDAVNFRDVATLIRVLAGWTDVRLGHSDSTEVITPATCTAEGLSKLVCTLCGSSADVKTAATGHNYQDGICILCNTLDPAYEDYFALVDWMKSKGTVGEDGTYIFVVDQTLDLYGYGNMTVFSLTVNPDDSTILTLTYAHQPDDQSFYRGTLYINPGEKTEHSFAVDYYYVDGMSIVYHHAEGTLDNSKNADFTEGYWGYSDTNMSYTSNLGALSASQLNNLESMTEGYMPKMFLEAEFELIGSNVSLADFGFIMN